MPLIPDRLVARLDRWLHDRRVTLIKRRFCRCGADFSLDLPAVIRGAEHIEIGDRVSINAFVHIWGQGGLIIGDDALLASHASITTLTHDVKAPLFRASLVEQPIVIGRNVWVGTHATLLPGVTVGDGAIIAAGAVVTRDVPAHTLVAGVPAAVVRTLSSAG